MTKRFAFLSLMLVASTQAATPDPSGRMNEGLAEIYRPFIGMQACTDIPPNGYFLIETRYVNSSTPCSGKWIFIFESHFDKPVGHQMTICAPTLPWTVPSNWYKIRDTFTTSCARRLGDVNGAAWIVQKG